MKPRLALGLLLGLGFCRLAPAQTPAPSPAPETVRLGHGFNLANSVEFTRDEGGGAIKAEHFKLIHDAGFTLVRVPISWERHVGPAPAFTVEPEFLQRIDWIVSQAEQNGLQVIVDYHHDPALLEDPAANTARFLTTWQQIAEHYKAAPSSVVFELMNEPHKKLNAAWNDLLAKALAVIRPTNPAREVIVGPVRFNAIDELPGLVLPENDRHLIVSFHYYDPMKFTHQGVSFIPGSKDWIGTKWEGTDADRKRVTDDFNAAKAWGAAHGRPIYLGEFGSTKKADADSRDRWTRCVARTAEADGFAWTYWDFHGGYGAYDPATKDWRAPLLKALQGK